MTEVRKWTMRNSPYTYDITPLSMERIRLWLLTATAREIPSYEKYNVLSRVGFIAVNLSKYRFMKYDLLTFVLILCVFYM